MLVPPLAPQPTTELQTYSNNVNTSLPDLVNEAAAATNTYTTPVHRPTESPTITTPIVSSSYNSNSYAIELPATPPTLEEQQHQLYQQYQQQFQHQYQMHQQQQTQPAAAATNDVPLSHLLASNAYPSLGRMPNASIVHSFAPVYEAPPAAVPTARAADIYQEYVQNPYNLTLQQAPQQDPQLQQLPQAHPQQHPQPAVTSPANYFNANIDPSKIPPGSELLYGQQ